MAEPEDVSLPTMLRRHVPIYDTAPMHVLNGSVAPVH
jgi:hypothetical protein